MSAGREPRLALFALAAGLSAIAYVFRERVLAGGTLAVGILQLCALAEPAPERPGGRHVIKLLGLSWTMEEFLTHWVVVGRSGSGKTAGVIRTLVIQLMHSAPGFGCIAIDEKANFHKVLARICAANGQPEKLIVLRPRRPGGGEAPAHTMNLIGDRSISWETYAQLVIDTAVACGQETNNSFFKLQGRKVITAIRALREAQFFQMFPQLALDARSNIKGGCNGHGMGRWTVDLETAATSPSAYRCRS